jgi:hypothetical protein
MRLISLSLLFVFTFGVTHAQEQMALRLNEQGIMKILRMAVQYNTSNKESRTIVIPKNIYKFTLPKSKFSSNPIIPIVNEISDLNLNKDLDFYLNTADIKVNGDADIKSLKSEILNSNDNGFDVMLSLSFSKISVNASSLSLCEDKKKGTKSCGSGLKLKLNSLSVVTINKPVSISIKLKVKTDGKVARVSVLSVNTNLDLNEGPGLSINFNSIDVPRIAIVIDGQETELDTTKLKDEILKRKSFLAKKLLSFVADFMANDLTEMINLYLINKSVATSYQIYKKEKPVKFDEFLYQRSYVAVPDNTYVYIPKPLPPKFDANQDPSISFMNELSKIIQSAQLGISLQKMTTPGNKDLELHGLMSFMLNGSHIHVSNTLGNSNRALPRLDLSNYRNNDINLAISEPLINGVLDVANSTHLFQKIFESMSPVQGFSIKSVKFHFSSNKAMVAVINAQIDLNKLASDGVTSWLKHLIAAWLERNNNNGIIYFPIEVSVIPVVKTLSNGGAGLDLKVLSPFGSSSLPNNYNYPTNIPNMTSTVKKGVMDELRSSIEPHMNKTYSVDLTKFLNQAGVVFFPKMISINQGAYLLMGLDITDIKFNSKNPNLR